MYLTLGARGFFFCSEAAIVSSEARISITALPLTIAASLQKKPSGTQGKVHVNHGLKKI